MAKISFEKLIIQYKYESCLNHTINHGPYAGLSLSTLKAIFTSKTHVPAFSTCFVSSSQTMASEIGWNLSDVKKILQKLTFIWIYKYHFFDDKCVIRTYEHEFECNVWLILSTVRCLLKKGVRSYAMQPGNSFFIFPC